MKFLGVGIFGRTLGVAFGAWMAACSIHPDLEAPPEGDHGTPFDAGMASAPDAGTTATDASSHLSVDATQAPPADGSTNEGHDAGILELDAGAPGHDAGKPSEDAGTAGQDAATEVDAAPYGWGERTDIEAIFQTYCTGCHGTTWQSCWNDQADESVLDSVISSGAMPRGTTMAASDKSAVLAWLSSGAPCAGPYPDAGGGSVILPPGGGTSGAPVGFAAAAAQ